MCPLSQSATTYVFGPVDFAKQNLTSRTRLIGQKVCVAFLVNPNKLEIPWTYETHSRRWHRPIAVRYYQDGYSALSYGK